MYDVEKLEREWVLYKSKQRIPWIATTAIVVLIILALFFREDLIKIASWSSTDRNVAVEENGSLDPYVPTMLQESNLSQIGDGANQPSTTTEDADKRANSSAEHKKKYLKIEMIDESLVDDEESEIFTEEGEGLSIKSVKSNFAQFNSSNDSLYLARAYYKIGDYAKAQKWALVTNNIDNEIEESWFIFAKSKVKSGRKEEALEILTAYIQKTNSAKARVLLQKIKKGKF